MAEVDARQKASGACGGRVSHERGRGGGGERRGGRRTRGQDVPGPINCTRRSPSFLSYSSAPLFFCLLYLRILFLYHCFPTDPTFLQSIVPASNLNLKPHLSWINEKSHACNTYRSLFYTFNHLWLLFVRVLCNIVVLLFATDIQYNCIYYGICP